MKIKIRFIIIFFAGMAFFDCTSYAPFSSTKDKKRNVKSIKSYIELSNSEYGLLKNNDTILYELSLSVKNRTKSNLIKRRLDSFFLKNYSKKELIHMLKLDRMNNKWVFELERDKDKGDKYPEFKTEKELQEYIKNVNKGLLKNRINSIETTKDSI